MPRNGSGTYQLPAGNPVISGTLIQATWANGTLNDVGSALTQSISRDGQTVPTANLPMGGFRHTNTGAAVNFTNYCRADQVQKSTMLQLSAVSLAGVDTYVSNQILAQTSFAVGQLVIGLFPTTNTGPSTLNINGAGASPIKRYDNSPLTAGDIPTTIPLILIWDGTAWRFINVAGVAVAGVSSYNGRTGIVVGVSADVTAALGYVPVSTGGGTLTGALSAPILGADFMATKKVELTPLAGTFPTTVDFTTFQSQVLTLTGATVVTAITGLAVGNMGRIVAINTNNALTLPASVVWPGPTFTIPSLSAGPLKRAIISLLWDGTNFLANAAVY